MEGGKPLADLELIAEPGPDPLELGMVPEELRRIVDAGPRHDPMLGEEGRSQVLEKFVGCPAAAPPMIEVHGERLDPLKLPLDVALVVGQ